jgi:hypothetical protein
MPAPVTVAIHVNRSNAIHSGRNRWEWLITTIDLEELNDSERDALARCPEHEGILRLSHSGPYAHGDSAELFLTDEGIETVNEATPETARVVIGGLIEQRARALDEAVATAEVISSEADAAITELEAWLRADPCYAVKKMG